MTNLDLEKFYLPSERFIHLGKWFYSTGSCQFQMWELTLLDDEQKLIPVVDGLKIDGEAAEEKPDLNRAVCRNAPSYQCNQNLENQIHISALTAEL